MSETDIGAVLPQTAETRGASPVEKKPHVVFQIIYRHSVIIHSPEGSNQRVPLGWEVCNSPLEMPRSVPKLKPWPGCPSRTSRTLNYGPSWAFLARGFDVGLGFHSGRFWQSQSMGMTPREPISCVVCQGAWPFREWKGIRALRSGHIRSSLKGRILVNQSW